MTHLEVPWLLALTGFLQSVFHDGVAHAVPIPALTHAQLCSRVPACISVHLQLGLHPAAVSGVTGKQAASPVRLQLHTLPKVHETRAEAVQTGPAKLPMRAGWSPCRKLERAASSSWQCDSGLCADEVRCPGQPSLLRSSANTHSIQVEPKGSTPHPAHCIAQKLSSHLQITRDAALAAWLTAALLLQARKNGSQVVSLAMQGSTFEVKFLAPLWHQGQPVKVWATSSAAVLQQCQPGSSADDFEWIKAAAHDADGQQAWQRAPRPLPWATTQSREEWLLSRQAASRNVTGL